MKNLTSKIDRRSLNTVAGAGETAHLADEFRYRARQARAVEYQRKEYARFETYLAPGLLMWEARFLAEEEAKLARCEERIVRALAAA